MGNLYIGLIHYPIQNKRGELITTSVTNMDIHDISRSCKTFDVKRFYLVTPLEAQHKLVNRILHHWEQDKNCAYNPDRHQALSIAKIIDSYQSARDEIEKEEGKKPIVIVTGAAFKGEFVTSEYVKKEIMIDKQPVFLLFGTGWGLHASILNEADMRLAPLKSSTGQEYNHLSVRSAVAIYLDRLRGSL